MVWLVAVAGLVLGGVVGALWSARRRGVTAATGEADVALAVANAQVANLTESLERERQFYEQALANLDATFAATSQRVYNEALGSFAKGQEDIASIRDARLKDNLEPLKEQLAAYERHLSTFDQEHREALTQVDRRAGELLEAQRKVVEETGRLNTLLGRSDARGRWGEIQLANVMDASGLRPGIDYDLQVTSTDDDGGRKRPDCVVHLPNRSALVVDAKFPFETFEQAIAATDPQERARLTAVFAQKLREHVKTLAKKDYPSLSDRATSFTVCFVPSDAALAAAIEGDPSLVEFAMKSQVLLAGPTNLLAILWSAGLVLKEHRQNVNAHEILAAAQELFLRVNGVAEHLVKVGKHLNNTMTAYNGLVGSVETRLLTSARRIGDLGGAPQGAALTSVDPLHDTARELSAGRWGASAPGDNEPGYLDLEALDE